MLQRQFVCVRVLRMNHVDLNVFQFDFDLTWMGFFLAADNHVYGRYGGRDAASDEGRISIAGLKNTMQRVLRLHAARQLTNPSSTSSEPLMPSAIFAVNQKQCLHCHQVWEGVRDRQRADGTFRIESLQVYPLPENLGAVLDVDDGTHVRMVIPESAVTLAGLRTGDELRQVAGHSVKSQADVSWALHNAPATGSLEVVYLRNGELRRTTLRLFDGWRKTDTSWRKSMN